MRARSPGSDVRETMGGVPALSSIARPEQVRRGRVLAVDNVDPFLDVLRTLVLATSLLELVGEARSGERALEQARICGPELVLMDVHMPGMGGVAATRAIKAEHPSAVIVLISAIHPDELAAEASVCGADEIVWKGQLRPHLLDAIWRRHRPTP